MRNELRKYKYGEIGLSEFIGIICLIVINWVLSAYCLEKYIEWFLNPIFGVKLITLSQAICLVLVIGFFRRGLKSEDIDKDNSNLEKLFAGLFGTGFYLVLGYIFYYYFIN